MDQTESYRQGVKIGNWNEDEYGIQLSRGETIVTHGQVDHYTTVQKCSFTTGVKEGIQQKYEQQVQPEMHKGVDRDILFYHKGADTAETRYETTAGTSWVDANLPQPRKSLVAQKQAQWEKDTNACKRMGGTVYETEAATNFTVENSAMASQPNHEHHRKNVLAETFSQPFRKLRLRET